MNTISKDNSKIKVDIESLNNLIDLYSFEDAEQSPFFNRLNNNLLIRAFSNSSFSPERRALGVQQDFTYGLVSDLKEVINKAKVAVDNGMTKEQCHFELIEPWFINYQEKIQALYEKWLHSESRTASSMVTDPANFPVERNRKRMQAALNNGEAINEYRKKAIKRILSKVIPLGDGSTIGCDDSNAVIKTCTKLAKLEKQREEMKEINKIIREQ